MTSRASRGNSKRNSRFRRKRDSLHEGVDAMEDAVTGAEHLNEEKLIDLMVTQSETEANIVRGILEDAGIHCVLITPVPHNIYPFTVDGLASIRIKVLDSHLEAAQTLLDDYKSHPESANDEDSGDLPESP